MKLPRLLLFPFSLLYGFGIMLRNWAYDARIIRSTEFNLPVISVGNIAVGGAGKSPMTEYLVRLLKNRYKIATLSRGYGRKTSGFLLVNTGDASSETGDEPLQFKRKFNDITVAVCEDRVKGISCLKQDHELIILDDAFQHRAVKPGLSILLFEYTGFFKFQWLLPSGDMRETMAGIKRANLIVVSKCPQNIGNSERNAISGKLKLNNQQRLFFSFLKYGSLQPMNADLTVRLLNSLNDTSRIILLTGIANAEPLLDELRQYKAQVIHQKYPDHHHFSEKNITKLVRAFNELSSGDNLIITTEKDVQRLNISSIKEQLKDLPVYYLPVEAEFHETEKVLFNNYIEEYASKPTVNN